MPSERPDSISDLYHGALARAPEDRAAFLAEACKGDGGLRKEVESLLEDQSASARFLERPPHGVAADNTRMASVIGRRIGPYTIVAPLGSGGMGEVYRARDSKLGRDVAVKILPEHFTLDPERRARFAREGRLLASLNHPHIAAIYGLEETDGMTALILELVEGPTLADHIGRERMRMVEVLAIARQITAALDTAHEKGIVHRDLKPDNIVLQHDTNAAGVASGGARVKVLDFGLAKLLPFEAGGDPLQAVPAFGGSGDGRILGTPAYMSPEQARGQPVDKRTDIWAFGCVLFEMLAGRRAFGHATLSETLVAILDREPDWSALPAVTPERIRELLRRCLQKDPAKRLRDIADAGLDIAETEAGAAVRLSGGDTSTSPVAATATTTESIRPSVAWLLLVVALSGSVGITSQAHLITVAPSELPQAPAVLAERAQTLAATAVRPSPPVDRAFWWWATEGDNRVQFSYRESPRLLVPANLFHEVNAYDPTPDPDGRLVTLNADGTRSPSIETSRDVWSTGRPRVGELSYWVALLAGVLASAILARRNLRAGEGDRKSAWWLSLFVSGGCAVATGLRAHHVPSVVDEIAWLFGIAGWSILWGIVSWLAYVSSEPYVRRWWPRVLTSCARLLAGHGRDPLVGRHVLVGVVIGVLAAALLLLQLQVSGRDSVPVLRLSALESLASPTMFASLFMFALVIGLLTSLIGMASLVALRLITGRTAIAAALLVVVTVPVFAAALSPVDVIFGIIFSVIGLTVLLRIGLLAHVSAQVVMHSLTWMPLTLDGDAWYFGCSLVVLLAVAAFAVYGFLAALGGQPAFGVLENGGSSRDV